MPYDVQDDAIVEVTIKGILAQQVVMSVLHYRVSDTGFGILGSAGLDDLQNKLFDVGSLMDKYTKCCSENLTEVRLVLQWVHPIRYAKQQYLGAFNSGQVAGDALPPNDTAAITKRSERAGRHYVGTLHMPAVPTTAVVNGNMNGIWQLPATDLGDVATQVIEATPGGARYHPLIFNRTAPAASPEWTTYVVQGTSRVGRRRTVGLGI